MRHRFIGTHADQLESGRPLAPGDFVELSEEELEQPYNQGLLERGLLIETGPEAEVSATEPAEQLAREHDIELASVTGTGSGGQVTVEDVRRTIKEKEGES